jgi:putative transposase
LTAREYFCFLLSMARPLRIVRPGLWYHITARGIERRPIFRDDSDNRHFVELLAELVERFGVRIHAYALMGNHYHLLVELGQPNLSRAVQWLNLSHSVWFNRRHRRCGYLFQGRFKSVLVDPVAWGLPLSAYIHLNPVRVASLGLAKGDRQQARAGAGDPPTAELVAARP